VLGTSYKAGVFESEFGDGSKLPADRYVVEDEPLGAGGGIANVSDQLRPTYDGVQRRRALQCRPWVLLGATRTRRRVTHLVRRRSSRCCVPTDSEEW
jgi:mannose-1-phosphate guanylyltransferase